MEFPLEASSQFSGKLLETFQKISNSSRSLFNDNKSVLTSSMLNKRLSNACLTSNYTIKQSEGDFASHHHLYKEKQDYYAI